MTNKNRCPQVVCRLFLWFAVLLFNSGLFLATVCSQQGATRIAAGQEFPVSFTNVAGVVGLSDPTIYRDIDRKRYIIETNGCGVAFVDYDNDGWVDLFMLSGTRLTGMPVGREPTNRLYRNRGNGTFAD